MHNIIRILAWTNNISVALPYAAMAWCICTLPTQSRRALQQA